MRWHRATRGISNYRTLLDDIRHHGNKDVTLVTFNYDCLLEFAIEHQTKAIVKSIDDYLNLGPYTLVKVHGSVNWGRVVSGGHDTAPVNSPAHIAESLIEHAATLEMTRDYLLATEEPPTVRIPREAVLFPAIAIPVQNKQEFECPQAHLEALQQRLQKTTHILIVGWAAMDSHFLRLLRKHLSSAPLIQVVCGPGSATNDATERIRSAGIAANYDAQGMTFTSYILRGAGAGFLEDAARA